MKSRRVELNAVAGLRVWATFLMVSGRAVESLWLDDSGKNEWLSAYTCSALRRVADDLVSFYFVLAGFQITWGYVTRDFDSNSVRIRYWVGRLQRFYPDYFISVIAALALITLGAGCWTLGPLDWLFNIGQLLLIGGMFAWIPYADHGNVNGPIWFLVTLVWLWFFFPWLINPMKASFRSESREMFVGKVLFLWVLSLVPWAVLLILYQYSTFLGYSSYEQLIWAFKPFPFFRMPEFLIGIALAIRISDSREYYELKGQSGQSDDSEPKGLWPFTIALCGFGAIAVYVLVSTITWDPRCGGCLSVSKFCFGWLQMVDTRFVPISAIIIYSTASLDVAAGSGGEDDQSQEAAVTSHAGLCGGLMWRCLSWTPFQEINRWGLQLFLYQMPIQLLWSILLIGIGFGLSTHCSSQALSPIFSDFYVASQICLTYLAAWLMHDRGPIGKYIHGLAQDIAKSTITFLDQQSSESRQAEARLI